MKTKLVFAAALALLLVAVASVAALAQDPPAPYAGMKNPFAWTDTAAQSAGKAVYAGNCSGCHGAKGNGVAAYDFSKAAYAKALEAKPDAIFYALSEGRLTKGMPPYKGMFSEQERWQLLTYIWSQGAPPAPTATPGPTATPVPGATPTTPAPTATPVPKDSLLLSSPSQGNTGDTITLVATARNGLGKPIIGAKVDFYIEATFFATGQVAIGSARTDSKGDATLSYELRHSGDGQAVAKYGEIETTSIISVADSGKSFYEPEVGIRMPTLGSEVFIGPESSRNSSNGAPMTALRLPGGALSWLWLMVLALVAVYGFYIIIMYQVLRISTAKGIPSKEKVTLVPTLAIFVLLGLATMVVLMVITGPFTHLNLLP